MALFIFENREARIPASAGMTKSGFTLIETLIVVLISAMLAAIAIGYSSIGRNQVGLSVETTKVSQLILQAESLSIATYGNAGGACGYGVSFNATAQTYSLFAYHPANVANCPQVPTESINSSTEMQQYTAETWNIQVENGVKLMSSGTNKIAAVLFYPPDPTTYISYDGSTFASSTPTSYIYMETVDGSESSSISISSAGQVSL